MVHKLNPVYCLGIGRKYWYSWLLTVIVSEARLVLGTAP